jgi:predicted nucleic acid-binding protein
MSGERFTLDTNILVHSIDNKAGARQRLARQVIERALRADCRLTLQAISEFYAAATRKGRMPATDAAAQAADWMELFPCLPSSATATRTALAAASAGRASYWDALLLATAAEGGCRVILTEDLSDGATVEGLRVINPFAGDDLALAAIGVLPSLA